MTIARAAAVIAFVVTPALCAADEAIYVRVATGVNSETAGLTPATPVASITYALTRAVATGRTRVQVAGGNYGAFAMVNGISVIGGFGQDFVQGSSGVAPTMVNIQSAPQSSTGYHAAVIADGITQPTTLA